MKQQLALVSVIVNDYDEAIQFYTKKLNFVMTEDTRMSETKRWVIVTPPGSTCGLLLAKAANDDQHSRVGNQTGGRVFLFLHTDNFQQYYNTLIENKITIVREKTVEPYGTVAVFKDLYGNMWDLIEPKKD